MNELLNVMLDDEVESEEFLDVEKTDEVMLMNVDVLRLLAEVDDDDD